MKREELLKQVNFYNPVPDVIDLRKSFSTAAAIQDPVTRILNLNVAADNAKSIVDKARENKINRQNNDLKWLKTTMNAAVITGILGSISTTTTLGALSGGPGGAAIGALVGIVGGGFGTIVTLVGAETAVRKSGLTEYHGMSKEMKTAFKEGYKAAQDLQKEIEAAFESTHKLLTPEICEASPDRNTLYRTFPRLQAEMQLLSLRANNAFAAMQTAPTAPTPVPAPKPKTNLRIIG